MTHTRDRPAPAGGPERLAHWAAAGSVRALDWWPRVVEALTRASLHAERACLFGASVLPWSALMPTDPRIAEAWAEVVAWSGPARAS